MTDDLVKRLRDKWQHSEDDCYEAADRIEELERKLAEEKRYFKEVNEQAWDVHSRIHELERQLDISNEVLHATITVTNPQEWYRYCREVIAKTRKILGEQND